MYTVKELKVMFIKLKRYIKMLYIYAPKLTYNNIVKFSEDAEGAIQKHKIELKVKVETKRSLWRRKKMRD